MSNGIAFVCGDCGRRYDAAGTCDDDDAPLAETADPLLGTEVARFRLARLLGRGGMGQVYLGIQPAIRSRVAIKLLSPDWVNKPELLQRFFTEARAVNLIRHENIVSITDLDQLASGQPYIVMEYVAGKTLRELLRDGPAPLGGVVHVMIDVLLALDAAHAAGIVHRDLKPDNVMVSPSGRAKVLDFGIAKLVEGPGLRTATGLALGTPNYMAPEQILDASCDARTDVYAAGVVLFELVTGTRPFEADSDFQLMEAQVRTAPPSPRALRPELPAAFEDVILRALAKDPDDRFSSARAMATALREAALDLAPDQLESFDRGVLLPVPPAITKREPVSPAPAKGGRLQQGTQPLERAVIAEKRQDPPTARETPRRNRPRPWPYVAIALLALGGIAIAFAMSWSSRPAPELVAIAPDAARDAPPDAAADAAVEAIVDAAVIATPTSDAGSIRRSPQTTSQSCTLGGDCPQHWCRCKTGGTHWAYFCDLDRGRCVVGADVCRRACADKGGWTGWWELTPQKPEDCATSPQCKRQKACLPLFDKELSCVTVTGCQDRSGCKDSGRCTYEAQRCIATSDADCARSTNCAAVARCSLEGTACVATDASCKNHLNCKQYGRCTAIDGECVAKTQADCAQACQAQGWCSLTADAGCKPTANDHCAASNACRDAGRCTLAKNQCIATTESCERSARCKTHGECRVEGPRCVR